jgi:methionine-gamma-lyase
MGAISATMWTLLSAGDSVVIDRILYGNTFAFFTTGLTRFGVNVRLADFTDPDALAQALAAEDKLKLVYFETPANPNLRVIDIARVSSLAKSAGALTIVGNTFAMPILQNPHSSSAPTTSFIRRRNILAAMAICLAARSSDRAR